MNPIDASIFALYLIAMLSVGVFFLRRNEDHHDYYVGGRSMGSFHVGLSVVATDVGGGFSIGLGGLGFAMGISGSWMLFTGLLGAWLAGVLLIPKIAPLGRRLKLFTYPQVFGELYSSRVAIVAAIISVIGYAGFTSSQLLAGAKLASASIEPLNVQAALFIMGIMAVAYTSMGGMKAVIYTDTVQWGILLFGLVFVGIPFCYMKLGGWSAVVETVRPEMLRLDNISWVQLFNWMATILPIWFVGMTLYQRIYACRDVKTAQRAWYVAGLLEWPIMAFMGVALGLLGRVAWDQGLFVDLGYAAGSTLDSEMGLPLLLRSLLPPGLMGIMLAAYFSAILSTADSCLMAASGNLSTDLLPAAKNASRRSLLLRSQVFTAGIGAAALLLASQMQNVLDLMLYSYAVMVSGLLVPTLAGLWVPRPSSKAAIAAMIAGGGTTLVLIVSGRSLWLGLDPNVFGLTASLVCFLVVQRFDSGKAGRSSA
jgi:SSS family solute:Na+ symporter